MVKIYISIWGLSAPAEILLYPIGELMLISFFEEIEKSFTKSKKIIYIRHTIIYNYLYTLKIVFNVWISIKKEQYA